MDWTTAQQENGQEGRSELRVFAGGARQERAYMHFASLLQAWDRTACIETVPWSKVERETEGFRASGESPLFAAESRLIPVRDEVDYFDVELELSFLGKHAYDPFVRQMYKLHKQTSGPNPWMGLEEAAELTAHGLFTWHYHPEHRIFYETAAFDREFNNNVKQMGDRPHMHVGWVSGAPYAAALLKYGRQHGRGDYAEAGIGVLDKIASGLAPSGTFWASWIVEKGWTTGWNPKRTWLKARTIAEATLFMTRALAWETERRSWAKCL